MQPPDPINYEPSDKVLKDLCRQIIGYRVEDNEFLLYHFNIRHHTLRQEQLTCHNNQSRRKQFTQVMQERDKQRKIAYNRLLDVRDEKVKILLADFCEWLNHKAWPRRDVPLSFDEEELEAITKPMKIHKCRVEELANDVNKHWRQIKEKEKARNEEKLHQKLTPEFVFYGQKFEPLKRW